MLAIYVWWIGADAADQTLLERVRTQLASTFELPTRVWHSDDRPADTWDPRRGQHSSTTTLRWLAQHRPHEARKMLAVTDVDLFIPVLTFVFGEAQLGGRVAVVSTARLGMGADGRRLLSSRLIKECVHELGHTFGLLHCATPGCVMGRSSNLPSVDAKASRLCPDCRLLYLEHLSREGDEHEQGADQDPGRR